MTIKAICPACTQTRDLGDNSAGEEIECTQCATRFVVPKGDASVVGETLEATSEDSGGNLYDRARKRNRDRSGPEVSEAQQGRSRSSDDNIERDGREKKRAGAGWSYVLLAVGLVGLGLIGILVVVFTRGAAVTEETYARIPLGMTAVEVKKLMGEPHETSGGDTNNPNRGGVMDTWAWKSGDNKIYVFLMNARVTSKTGKFGTKTLQESAK